MAREAKRPRDCEIGQRLREARQRAGLSAREAAETRGLHSHSTVLEQESGRNRVPMEHLAAIAKAYHVKASDLLKPPGSKWTERKRRARASKSRTAPLLARSSETAYGRMLREAAERRRFRDTPLN